MHHEWARIACILMKLHSRGTDEASAIEHNLDDSMVSIRKMANLGMALHCEGYKKRHSICQVADDSFQAHSLILAMVKGTTGVS